MHTEPWSNGGMYHHDRGTVCFLQEMVELSCWEVSQNMSRGPQRKGWIMLALPTAWRKWVLTHTLESISVKCPAKISQNEAMLFHF